MWYHYYERRSMYKYLHMLSQSLLCVLNPAYKPAPFDEEEEEESSLEKESLEEAPHSRENAMYDNDVARSDRAGKYVANEDRIRLYKKHMELLKKRDPRVRIIAGTAK